MVRREPGVVQEGFPEEVSKKAPRERKNQRWGLRQKRAEPVKPGVWVLAEDGAVLELRLC